MQFSSTIALGLLASTVSVAHAQLTFNGDGTITCAIPDAAYCAADSLQGNIIIRCDGTVGHPGNCNDNLSGLPPVGINYAPCWQSSSTSGDAACSKNCEVVRGSGSGKESGSFILPASECTPQTPASTVTAHPTGFPTGGSGTASPTSTITYIYPIPSNSTTYIQSSSFVTSTIATESIPSATTTTTVGPIATGTGSIGTGTGAPGCVGNCTIPTGGSGSPSGSSGAATNTPKSPSATPSAPFTGSATTNSAGALLAAVGIVFAYFL